MSRGTSVVWSSVGKKFLTGITGLLLVGFITVHLLGNLSLYKGAAAFNSYAHFLESLAGGWVVIVFELGLLAVFLVHMAAAVTVAWLDKQAARKEKYRVLRNAGGTSKKTLASRSMIVTGIVVIVFVVLHVKMFKFAGEAGTFTTAHGDKIADLYSVVVHAFKDPVIAFLYVAVMILLGLHLRHGFWSAFQSLGWANDRWLPLLYGLALVVALVLAVGFLLLPLYIHFNPAVVPLT